MLESKTTGINILAVFDAEEIGSKVAYGADSNMLSSALERILSSKFGGLEAPPNILVQTLAKSMFVSADMAHGIHPNCKHPLKY